MKPVVSFTSISSLLNESYIIEGATVIAAGLNRKQLSELLLMKPKEPSPGGLEPPAFRLTAERANDCATETSKERCTIFVRFNCGDEI